MKTFLAAIALLALAQTASADVTFLVIDNKSAETSDFEAVTVSSNGSVTYNITAVVSLAASFDLLAEVIDRLAPSAQQVAGFKLAVLNARDGSIADVRKYLGVTVTSIQFDELRSGAHDPIRVFIRMKAQSVTTGSGAGWKIPERDRNVEPLIQNHYSLTMAGLPTRQVACIYNLELIPCFQNNCDSVAQFQMCVRSGESGAWLTWFTQTTAGSATTKDAEIRIYGIPEIDGNPKVKASIKLIGVRPTGFTDEATSSGTQARVTLNAFKVKVALHN